VFGAGVAAILCTGLLDTVTGPNLSLELLYLLTVAAISALAGRTPGAAVAILTIPVSFAADARNGRGPGLLLLGANIVLRFVVLILIVELISALTEAVAASQASEQQSKDFLGMAAHQLRNPLSGIGTTAEALVLAGARPDQEALLSALAGETQRAGRLVAALLRVARLDQDESLPMVDTAIEELCEQEIDRAQRRSPHLRFDMEDWSPPPVTLAVNEDSIREAIANILDNASRHAVNRVSVRLRLTENCVVIDIRDDGPGVPAGHEERIFERFVSLDHAGGTGLGLAIARGIVQRHGGKLAYMHGSFNMKLPTS
jgi:signal transduction histidine kinase